MLPSPRHIIDRQIKYTSNASVSLPPQHIIHRQEEIKLKVQDKLDFSKSCNEIENIVYLYKTIELLQKENDQNNIGWGGFWTANDNQRLCLSKLEIDLSLSIGRAMIRESEKNSQTLEVYEKNPG